MFEHGGQFPPQSGEVSPGSKNPLPLVPYWYEGWKFEQILVI